MQNANDSQSIFCLRRLQTFPKLSFCIINQFVDSEITEK